ncbi:Hsp20/alpha crystallin family protein [Cognatilysobacter lacus]|uniref:Hsp20 family protein n=1 Tax=Cognatilysobacter lacus TaxID=1643323 RepID=A0A5D8ZAC0_9GAMM|nr:HSP20 family small heat-shock protein [Lysobacter lacus]TZF91858.1 Hsp20 family protein [Lysobacter lacus]
MNLTNYPQQRGGQPQAQDELKQLFERFFNFGENTGDDSSVVTSQWIPRVDIVEEPSRFVLFADLPGVQPSEVEVLMDKGILSIRGERRSAVDAQSSRYSRVERRYGSFHRRFALPDSADPERITAEGHDGVLQVSIPKRPETTPRRIQVGGNGRDAQAGEGTRQ